LGGQGLLIVVCSTDGCRYAVKVLFYDEEGIAEKELQTHSALTTFAKNAVLPLLKSFFSKDNVAALFGIEEEVERLRKRPDGAGEGSSSSAGSSDLSRSSSPPREGEEASPVSFLEALSSEDHLKLLLVTPIIGETLETHMKDAESFRLLTPRDIYCIIFLLFRNMGEMHSAGFKHLDIKPLNLVLGDENGERRLQLIDFGLSQIINVAISVDARFVQQSYAPLTEAALTPATDVYAACLITTRLLCGVTEESWPHEIEKLKRDPATWLDHWLRHDTFKGPLNFK
jgi:serine/threonine protein kinase